MAKLRPLLFVAGVVLLASWCNTGLSFQPDDPGDPKPAFEWLKGNGKDVPDSPRIVKGNGVITASMAGKFKLNRPSPWRLDKVWVYRTGSFSDYPPGHVGPPGPQRLQGQTGFLQENPEKWECTIIGQSQPGVEGEAYTVWFTVELSSSTKKRPGPELHKVPGSEFELK